MKNYHYKAHITFKDGATDSATSADLSTLISYLGGMLHDSTVAKWKVTKVFGDEIGGFELFFHSETE